MTTKTMTVRVINRGRGHLYTGMTVDTVTIAATCPVCGGPRGEPTPRNGYEDGAPYICDVWTNPCGHLDTYSDVIAEAVNHATA